MLTDIHTEWRHDACWTCRESAAAVGGVTEAQTDRGAQVGVRLSYSTSSPFSAWYSWAQLDSTHLLSVGSPRSSMEAATLSSPVQWKLSNRCSSDCRRWRQSCRDRHRQLRHSLTGYRQRRHQWSPYEQSHCRSLSRSVFLELVFEITQSCVSIAEDWSWSRAGEFSWWTVTAEVTARHTSGFTSHPAATWRVLHTRSLWIFI